MKIIGKSLTGRNESMHSKHSSGPYTVHSLSECQIESVAYFNTLSNSSIENTFLKGNKKLLGNGVVDLSK